MNKQFIHLTDEKIEIVKRNLNSISNGIEAVNTNTFEFLKHISTQIIILIKRGYTLDCITEILHHCDFPVTTKVLQEFVMHELVGRITRLESNLDYRLKHETHISQSVVSEIEHALQTAIDKNEGLFLVYQPQIDVRSAKIIGAEALIRWRHRGMVIQPDVFINIAEQSSLIHELGEWVMREASAEAKNWSELRLGGDTPIKISVNVSAGQLDSDLPKSFDKIIKEEGIDYSMVGVEITESMKLNEKSLPVLHDLKNLGLSLSVDDFGTGYSSLYELKCMSFDTLKIDKSFVQNLENDSRSRMMIGSIVDFAEKFNMNTVAEGVETLEQVDILSNLRCNLCQGFLFSEPLSPSGFIRFFDQGMSDLHFYKG